MADTHSPLPWRFIDSAIAHEPGGGEIGDLRSADGYGVAAIGRELRNGNWRITRLDKANAALLLRAVNSHAALLRAAEVAIKEIEFLYDQLKRLEPGSYAALRTLNDLRQAVAAAKGDSHERQD